MDRVEWDRGEDQSSGSLPQRDVIGGMKLEAGWLLKVDEPLDVRLISLIMTVYSPG